MNTPDRARLLADLDRLEADRREAGYVSADVPLSIRHLRSLLSALDAADALVCTARTVNSGRFEDERMTRALLAYDAATTAKDADAR